MTGCDANQVTIPAAPGAHRKPVLDLDGNLYDLTAIRGALRPVDAFVIGLVVRGLDDIDTSKWGCDGVA